tara:strand:- start:535 stop:1443 length:909 start_codon:yes stop_codon:yes gene_type:complete
MGLPKQSLIRGLILVLSLQGCAGIPQYTDEIRDCEPYVAADRTLMEAIGSIPSAIRTVMPLICKDQPEIIRLPSYIELMNLPPAEIMPIVAVYGFVDKTGQRRPEQNIASFSTAVTQGGTEILIDALKSAGNGKWFRVVERTGLDNLVRERQIIRSTREEYAGQESTALNPLLFAGMIIEGGIIGYDTNVVTGGRGARTLGIGFQQEYRKDVVTISIRAVSVLTGEILLNVQARKTIFSFGGGGDLFRFIEDGTQLLEYEDGIGMNESTTVAVRIAVEAGVLELIHQGDIRGYWKIQQGETE